jgi:hypothetical protein
MTHSPEEQARQSDLVAEKSTAKPSPNPFAHSASIAVSVPETVEIKLVDASALADYEVWFLITSILSSAVVGFLVATVQAHGQPIQGPLLAVTCVFGALMIISAIMAFVKRRKLTAKAKRLKFRVGDEVEE